MEQIELSGSEIYRMEIRNLNSELARVRTHSAAQAETVAELNGRIMELEELDAKCCTVEDQLSDTREELRQSRTELATLKTQSREQAETVAELNGEIAELQNQIHEWEESDAAGEAFTAIIDRQQTEIARLGCEIVMTRNGKDAEIARLNHESLKWISAYQDGEDENQTLRAEVEQQRDFIAEQTRNIFALDERNLEHQHEEKRLRAEVERLKAALVTSCVKEE